MRRFLLRAGLALIAIGVVPIALYALVGPADGNPVGLGLLLWLAAPPGLALLAVGGVWSLVARR